MDSSHQIHLFRKLRVGFTESATWQGVVPDSFRQFRQQQPDAELQLNPLSSLQQVEAIRAGRLDAGFVFHIPKTGRELDSSSDSAIDG